MSRVPVPESGMSPTPRIARSPRNKAKAHALGLTSATGLVVGSVVGTGVFTMPAVLAGAGTMGIVVLAVIAVGAMLLAALFGQLTERIPHSDGGLYAYARHEFGDFTGYLVGWSYWISAWAGNAAAVASWVFYADALIDLKNPSSLVNWGIALVGLWVPAIVNLVGVRQMAWFQNVTVVLKFLPLLFVGVVGWFFVEKAHFGPFNASGGSLYGAIGIAAGVALFSFIGVEAAAITAKRVMHGQERRSGVVDRHRDRRPAIRAGDGGGHGFGSPWRACAHRGAVRRCLRSDVLPECLGGKVFRRGCGDLGDRGAQRLDADRHRGLAGDRPGRLIPAALRLDRSPQHGVVRHRGRSHPAVAADAVALHIDLGADGLHVSGEPHRGDCGHRVRLLRGRPADLPGQSAPAGAGLAAGP